MAPAYRFGIPQRAWKQSIFRFSYCGIPIVSKITNKEKCGQQN
jgi:hypothetical protein